MLISSFLALAVTLVMFRSSGLFPFFESGPDSAMNIDSEVFFASEVLTCSVSSLRDTLVTIVFFLVLDANSSPIFRPPDFEASGHWSLLESEILSLLKWPGSVEMFEPKESASMGIPVSFTAVSYTNLTLPTKSIV